MKIFTTTVSTATSGITSADTLVAIDELNSSSQAPILNPTGTLKAVLVTANSNMAGGASNISGVTKLVLQGSGIPTKTEIIISGMGMRGTSVPSNTQPAQYIPLNLKVTPQAPIECYGVISNAGLSVTFMTVTLIWSN